MPIIIDNPIVCSTVHSRWHLKQQHCSTPLAFCQGNTLVNTGSPPRRTCNAESVLMFCLPKCSCGYLELDQKLRLVGIKHTNNYLMDWALSCQTIIFTMHLSHYLSTTLPLAPNKLYVTIDFCSIRVSDFRSWNICYVSRRQIDAWINWLPVL